MNKTEYIIGYYSKKDNSLLGYLYSNLTVIGTNIELACTVYSLDWGYAQAEGCLNGFFNWGKGHEADEYYRELFKGCEKEEVNIRIIDKSLIIRNLKLKELGL